MTRNISLSLFLCIWSITGLIGSALAADPIYTSFFNQKAVYGFDTVSYFVGDGKPIKGSERFKTQWRGAVWFFSSKANLDKFKANPTQYAPQYGGYCAWAIAQGKLYRGNPKYYTLENGKLYLNYDKKINDRWLKKKAFFIKKANEQYPQLVDLN